MGEEKIAEVGPVLDAQWNKAKPAIARAAENLKDEVTRELDVVGQKVEAAVTDLGNKVGVIAEDVAEAIQDKAEEVAAAAGPWAQQKATDAVFATPEWTGWAIGKGLTGTWWFMSGGCVQILRMFSPLEWLQIGFVGVTYGGTAFLCTPFGKKMVNDMWDIRTLQAKSAIGKPKLLADF